jgi:hypothetical protein
MQAVPGSELSILIYSQRGLVNPKLIAKGLEQSIFIGEPVQHIDSFAGKPFRLTQQKCCCIYILSTKEEAAERELHHAILDSEASGTDLAHLPHP